VAGVAGTVAEVAGTAGIEGGSTEARITVTDSIAPDIIDSTGVGVGLPVDTIRGGCFRCRCPTRITDITVPVMDTDMAMGPDLATGTDTDGRCLNKRSIYLERHSGVYSSRYMMTLVEKFRKVTVRVEEPAYATALALDVRVGIDR
jgi:hypothetical protein